MIESKMKLRWLGMLLVLTLVSNQYSKADSKTNQSTNSNKQSSLHSASSIVPVIWDTIHTDCISLTVGNNGNAGAGGIGRANMDWIMDSLSLVDSDWKTDADVYLYDGSIVAGWIDGTDTIMYYSMYASGTETPTANSLIPLDIGGIESPSPYLVQTGNYSTGDSTLIFNTKWYSASGTLKCGIIIKRTIVTAPSGASNILIGEVVDWNIPSDSSNEYNSAGNGAYNDYKYIYQQGIEIPGWNDSIEEWNADERYGAMMFAGAYKYDSAGVLIDMIPPPLAHTMYIADNATYVDPYINGFDNGLLYQNHVLPSSELIQYGSVVGDLHSGITYVAHYDIGPTDTLYIFTVFATRMNSEPTNESTPTTNIYETMLRATFYFEWIFNHFDPPGECCFIPGDTDNSGQLDIADLTATVEFMFNRRPIPFCYNILDINNDCWVNIADLTFRVNYMFKGGPAPTCGCAQ